MGASSSRPASHLPWRCHRWWYGAGITGPAQASAFFVNNLRVSKEDSFLEVFQVSLIQDKLPHHRPIRDSPTTLEQLFLSSLAPSQKCVYNCIIMGFA